MLSGNVRETRCMKKKPTPQHDDFLATDPNENQTKELAGAQGWSVENRKAIRHELRLYLSSGMP